jgi:type II secretory pathway component GspD/PulD (secretin)
VVAAAAMLTVAACAGPGESDIDEHLVDGGESRGWIEVDTRTEAGRRAVAAELLAARSRVGPMLAAKRTVEETPVGAGEGQETRPTTQPSPREAPRLPPWPGPPIAMVFNEAPLRDVVASVASEIGVNVVIPQGLAEPVSVNFPRIDPLFGLDLVLREHGHRVIWEDSVLRVGAVERKRETKTFVVKSHRTIDTEKLVKPLLSEDAVLVSDTDGRSFTVTDEPAALERVACLLATFDSRLPQVLIEAVIVEVHRTKNCEWGSVFDLGEVSFGDGYEGVLQSTLPAASPLIGPPPFQFGLTNVDNMLRILLSGQKGKTRLNVLSNPIVTAISGEEAGIEVIERVPYIQSTNTINVAGTGAATNSSSQIAYEDVGVKLKVTPEVGADRVIRMKVEPIVRELVGFRLATPVIDERRVTSSVHVRDNETLVIGGLYRSAKRRAQEKSPIFGDIPLIGDTFFSHLDAACERVELLLFVTPHLIGPGHADPADYRPRRDMLGTGRRFDGVERESACNPGVPEGTRAAPERDPPPEDP